MTSVDRGEVVCAILDGEVSKGAAHLAARLAERLSLRLALVHVQAPVPPPDLAIAEGPHPVAPMAVSLIQPPDRLDPPHAEADDWEKVLVCSVPIRRDRILGRPANALKRLSDAVETRLLVVVDVGGGPLSSKFSGNAARGVIHDAGCPIVLVAADCPPDHANVRNILCGLDEDDATSSVARLAASLAGRLGGRLRFVHVVRRAVSGAAPEPVALDALHENGRRAAQAVFAACRAAIGQRALAEYVVVEGDAADGLRVAAREFDAGLLVIGRPEYAALGSALLGSAAHDILRDAGCPVVVVPVGDAAREDAPARLRDAG
ncbi:MAG: universal stress protein [Actinomycetota bacterium]|nr:universal stress protein [Actinomycetota bacterium]